MGLDDVVDAVEDVKDCCNTAGSIVIVGDVFEGDQISDDLP